MVGYWHKPRSTAEVMRGDWYLTGDLGYRDEDSYLYLVDRVKDMIVSGGENIYSTEVEDALATHRAVEEVAVFGVPDQRWGETVYAVVFGRIQVTPTSWSHIVASGSPDSRYPDASSCAPSRCPSRQQARSSSATCVNRTGQVGTRKSQEASHAKHDDGLSAHSQAHYRSRPDHIRR
jgi:hypothetical protein